MKLKSLHHNSIFQGLMLTQLRLEVIYQKKFFFDHNLSQGFWGFGVLGLIV
jgi:hypothetical protein